MICHKCTGRGTKRHHRDCPHRGEGHKGRGARIAYLATLAVEHGLVLRVRRGRHGAGLSLPEARAHLHAGRRSVHRGPGYGHRYRPALWHDLEDG